MKTLSVQTEIATLEAELRMKSALGREYFSNEATEMKLKLQELKMIEIFSHN